MAAGITSHGAYVPTTRLSVGRGERAVAAHDEDALTMAVAAAIDCLGDTDRSTVDGVTFASTTHPFREKQGASLIARALGLPRDIRTADIGGSLRAGTSALRSAVDAVTAGTSRNVLVVASDCRMAAPRSPLERTLGDAAAAFLVGPDAAVELEAAHTVSEEIIDVWRANDDRFVKSWEDRFVVAHGYRDSVEAAVKALGESTGSTAADFDRAVVYAPNARAHARMAKTLRLAPERTQDPLFGKVGNAGAAFVPLMLVAALEDAVPGQRLLVAAGGDGAEALALRTTARLAELSTRRGVRGHLERRRTIDYDTYVRSRKLEEGDRRPMGGISATKHWRDRDSDLSFVGWRCRKCETMAFPAQRVCVKCYARDDFDAVPLSHRRGRVLSYTFDHFHPSAERPTIAGIVDIDGCRAYLQMTDASPEELRCDLPVELTFRRIHEAGGMPNYFWKSTPVTGDA